LGSEAGRGEPSQVRGSGEFGVLVVGEADVDRPWAAGKQVEAVAAGA
jgi:hypothetical protein